VVSLELSTVFLEAEHAQKNTARETINTYFFMLG